MLTLFNCISLTACQSEPVKTVSIGPTPLQVASCPQLTPLADASFGATTDKLVEIAGIYYECRASIGIKP